jgi:hypothetical protein
VTTHAGVWGATNDDGIRLVHENGFMNPETTGGSISVATESECSAGQGHAPTEQVLQYGIPVSLSMDTSAWWSGSQPRSALGWALADEELAPGAEWALWQSRPHVETARGTATA